MCSKFWHGQDLKKKKVCLEYKISEVCLSQSAVKHYSKSPGPSPSLSVLVGTSRRSCPAQESGFTFCGKRGRENRRRRGKREWYTPWSCPDMEHCSTPRSLNLEGTPAFSTILFVILSFIKFDFNIFMLSQNKQLCSSTLRWFFCFLMSSLFHTWWGFVSDVRSCSEQNIWAVCVHACAPLYTHAWKVMQFPIKVWDTLS